MLNISTNAHWRMNLLLIMCRVMNVQNKILLILPASYGQTYDNNRGALCSWVYWLYLVVLYLNLLLPGGTKTPLIKSTALSRLGSTLQRASSVNAAGRISMIHIFLPVLATIMLNFTLVLNKTNLSYLNCLIFPHRVTELPFKTVSIKWGLPTANYRLRTGYETRTRYKMQARYETWTMDCVYI